MNNQNLLYALFGGSLVALAWIASFALAALPLVGALGFYMIAAVVFVMVQDYRNSAKALR